MGTHTRADRLRMTVERAFAPAEIDVIDQSARHAGHAGASPAGETHYDVTIVSDAFQGMSRVARSRRVHELLAAEFESGLHALSLRLQTRKEASQNTFSRPEDTPTLPS